MDTSKLRRFAQFARRTLIDQVSAKVKLVRTEGSAAQREQPEAIKELQKQIKESSREQLIERVAYTWFNRFCALRFMDVNRYTRIGVVSPAEGQFQPEILAEAKQGHLDEEMIPIQRQRQIQALLSGQASSRDPQAEAYRLMIVAVCNHYHKAMPYLFERIADYTELLMPDDLLSGNSILAYTREALTPEACQDVEVIGWLYQFYISEKKDQVFEGLRKNRKISPDDIPAATQLFTPHWIVRYLVENSLGRLWMLNRPNSRLIEQMEYYIPPQETEKDFLRINKPEELKMCDSACGSGHILVYGFDLLYAIYEEEGYAPTEISAKILTHNLYGIEIDERAGELAAFALTMKARAKDRRFFRRPVQPNICVLRNIKFTASELKEYMDFIGRDLFTDTLQTTLSQFAEANNFGSLIRPVLTDVASMLAMLESKSVAGQLLLSLTHEKVLQALKQADSLSPKYHVVVANPPYMGSKGMNEQLSSWAKDNYPDSKSDLFAMFIERNLDLAVNQGAVAMITMQSWMFLSSFEKLRTRLIDCNTIISMIHLGVRAFNSIGGEVVSTTAFVIENVKHLDYKGAYLRLTEGNSEAEKEAELKKKRNYPFFVSTADFKKIPGSPIAYWVSEKISVTFEEPGLGESIVTEGQNKTANNDKFVRLIWEVSRLNVGRGKKWVIYSKGGNYRKWFGNLEHIVDWSKEAREHYRRDSSCRIIAEKFWYKEGITWTDITSSGTAFRYLPSDTTFDMSGPTAFFEESKLIFVYLCLLNSNYTRVLLPILNPTLHVQLRDVKSIPKLEKVTEKKDALSKTSQDCIDISKEDWDSSETSWDFTDFPILRTEYRRATLAATYNQLCIHWQEITQKIHSLEKENNHIFISAYNLENDLVSDVPLNEITLSCNPYYRYGSDKSHDELEELSLADTMKEFISYSVGCMFGRYALEKPGLILANQGETIADYLKQIPAPRFAADEDNVIPMVDLEGDWFADDIVARFRTFLRVTFGAEHYAENLSFIEEAIGKSIYRYFVKDFYTDHVKRYKKRPIYWLFSSPKGSFNALIYMHRYRPDTVSVVLNDYLREFRSKLTSEQQRRAHESISATATSAAKTKALKEIEKLRQIITELDDYERDILYPLATQQITIDLDDGVKVNYPKFGAALKKIPGLDVSDE